MGCNACMLDGSIEFDGDSEEFDLNRCELRSLLLGIEVDECKYSKESCAAEWIVGKRLEEASRL